MGDLPAIVIDSIYADVRFDRSYFAVHSLLMGGGVSRGLKGQLVQSPDQGDNAMSLVFKHVDPNAQEELVAESTPLNIVFNTGNTIWMVEDFPGTIDGPYYLSSNGVEGNRSTRFQIKKVSCFSYKLVFCPDENTCIEVGCDGQRRLTLATSSSINYSYFPIVFAQADSGSSLPVVLDGFFNHVTRDKKYFVLNVLSIDGGGVTRGASNEILQSAEVTDFGMSVLFKPEDPSVIEITESTPLNILFYSSNNKGTVWRVEEKSSPNYLLSNGVEGDRSSLFQIKRANYCSYKLVFCHNEYSRDVGVVKVNGERRLALITTGTTTTTTFPVLFLKPNESPNTVVFDSYLHDLRFDRRYFVVNSLSNAGGVVVQGQNNELVQTTDAADYGMSVVFKPMDPNSKEEFIHESTPLNIVFYTSSSSGNVWNVKGFPGGSDPYFLSSDGVEGNPNQVSSWFQIKKCSYFSFKLVFCPYENANAYREVGLQDVGGRLVLTTTKTNFPLVFVPDQSSI